MDAVSEMKSYSKRTEGCAIKFKRDDPDFSLLAFAAESLLHMENCGMDTVFYMNGVLADGTGGEELFTFHTKFTRAQVEAHIQTKLTNATFDQFCKSALQESGQWLLNSLDESLKSSLRPQLTHRPSGPVIWMLIVSEVQSESLRRCTVLRKEFEALSLASFPGENVRDYAKKAQSILIQLEREDQLSTTHLLDIVDHLSACTVMDFKIIWMAKRPTVNSFLKNSAGKSKTVIAAMPDKIHFNDLLEAGKTDFGNLQHLWGKDHQTPKEKALTASLHQLQAKVTELNQKLSTNGSKNPDGKKSSGGKFKCHNCGKEGHIRPHCPDLKKPKDPKDDKSSNKAPGKWAPPKDNDPLEKEIDGKKMKWCAKCRRGKGRWNDSHTTADHQPGFIRNNNRQGDGGGTTNANMARIGQALRVGHSPWLESDE